MQTLNFLCRYISSGGIGAFEPERNCLGNNPPVSFPSASVPVSVLRGLSQCVRRKVATTVRWCAALVALAFRYMDFYITCRSDRALSETQAISLQTDCAVGTYCDDPGDKTDGEHSQQASIAETWNVAGDPCPRLLRWAGERVSARSCCACVVRC